VLKLLHVALAFAFVSGLIGRWLLLRMAARTAGVVTQALRAAFRDRAVAAARSYEMVAVAAIVALMVLKPF